MSELKKATLQEISSDENAPPPGEEIEVQFNPTTLRLQINNSVTGGEQRNQTARQPVGSTSTVLSLDLIFDTADEGTTDKPRNVREKTAVVEKFVLPSGEGNDKQAAPKLRFHWGTLIFDGVLETVSIDFDLFAADGTPLRAKVSLAIKEQNSKYQYMPKEDAAGGAPPAPGEASAGALGSSGGISANFALAIGGESSAEFAARLGLDASAWRGLSIGASSSLSLEAGLEVGFSAGLSASAGLGVTVGVQADVSASLEASFGLEASASVSAVAGVGIGGNLAAGFALSAAGGVSAAVEAVQIAKSEAAVQQARRSFGEPPTATQARGQLTSGSGAAATVSSVNGSLSPASGGGSASVTSSTAPVTTTTTSAATRPGLPAQSRPSLASSGLPSLAEQQAAAPAPAPPRVDRRAVSFGMGVPLRSRVGQAADLRAGSVQGRVALRAQVKSSLPPVSNNPTTPPWVGLPASDRARRAADKMQGRLKPAHPCGCSSPCGHRGGK